MTGQIGSYHGQGSDAAAAGGNGTAAEALIGVVQLRKQGEFVAIDLCPVKAFSGSFRLLRFRFNRDGFLTDCFLRCGFFGFLAGQQLGAFGINREGFLTGSRAHGNGLVIRVGRGHSGQNQSQSNCKPTQLPDIAHRETPPFQNAI